MNTVELNDFYHCLQVLECMCRRTEYMFDTSLLWRSYIKDKSCIYITLHTATVVASSQFVIRCSVQLYISDPRANNVANFMQYCLTLILPLKDDHMSSWQILESLVQLTCPLTEVMNTNIRTKFTQLGILYKCSRETCVVDKSHINGVPGHFYPILHIIKPLGLLQQYKTRPDLMFIPSTWSGQALTNPLPKTLGQPKEVSFR